MISNLIMVLGNEAEFPRVRSKVAFMNAHGQIDLICSSVYIDRGSVSLGIRSSVFRATHRHVQILRPKQVASVVSASRSAARLLVSTTVAKIRKMIHNSICFDAKGVYEDNGHD